MPVIEVGLFHRLGIAARGEGEAAARTIAAVMDGEVVSSKPEPGDTHVTTMIRVGAHTVALFVALPADTTGTIARYVDRYGAGLHSLAWRTQDLEGAEAAVRERGLRVTGVNREARHWFFHPKETFGILIEMTDQAKDASPLAAGSGVVRDIAWMTAVVDDVDVAYRFFSELFGASRLEGLPAGDADDETTYDLLISDVVIRLVSVRSSESRYASAERRGLQSLALEVPDLADVTLPIVERDGPRAWTDPAETLGVSLEWVVR